MIYASFSTRCSNAAACLPAALPAALPAGPRTQRLERCAGGAVKIDQPLLALRWPFVGHCWQALRLVTEGNERHADGRNDQTKPLSLLDAFVQHDARQCNRSGWIQRANHRGQAGGAER
jgi:hypothetical protein